MLKNISAPVAALASAGIFALALLLSAAIITNTKFIIRDLGGNSVTGAPANSISVSESGEAFIKPDTANFSVGVSERAATTQEAIRMANEKINKIRDVLKSRVSAENIQTSGFTLYPEYDYRDSGRVLTGQRAAQTVSVKVEKIKADGSDVAVLIDEIAKVNNVEFNSIYFTAENDQSGVEAARVEAMTKAKRKAEQLANAGGVKILTPISISETTGSYNPPMYRGVGQDASAGGGEKDTKLSPGELKISVTVNVVYAIE
jgi:uncharacterized protein YggE